MLSYAHTVILLTCVTLFTVSFVGNRFLQYQNDIQENEKELGYDPFTGAVHIMSVFHTRFLQKYEPILLNKIIYEAVF